MISFYHDLITKDNTPEFFDTEGEALQFLKEIEE
jgi:hypothetical protein